MTIKSPFLGGIFAILFLTISCNLFNDDEPSNDNMPATGSTPEPFGTFLVSLVDADPSYTQVEGKMNDNPTPPVVVYEETAADGHCRLFTPRQLLCEPDCGSKATCVEDGKCQDYPQPITVGTVTLEGVKTADGKNTVSMDPLNNKYTGLNLAYPPFEEGDTVTLTAEGDATVTGFTITAKAISPLNVLNDSITLADGQPVNLEWTPPSQPDQSTISVLVDFNTHGGTRRKIECEVPDTGKLTLAASLLDKLKALGFSGFPQIEITRISKGTSNSSIPANLVLESKVKRLVWIPEVVYCDPVDENADDDCPPGQSCQDDALCK